MRPAPTSENDPIINTYYDVLLDDSFGFFDSGPAVGQIVTVRFTDLKFFFMIRELFLWGRNIILLALKRLAGKGLMARGLLKEKVETPLTPAPPKRTTSPIRLRKDSLWEPPNDRVVGEDIRGAADAQGNRTSLRRIVQNELAFWKDRVETSGDMDGDGVNETDERLQLYYDYVFVELHKYKKPQAIKDSRGYYHWVSGLHKLDHRSDSCLPRVFVSYRVCRRREIRENA